MNSLYNQILRWSFNFIGGFNDDDKFKGAVYVVPKGAAIFKIMGLVVQNESLINVKKVRSM